MERVAYGRRKRIKQKETANDVAKLYFEQSSALHTVVRNTQGQTLHLWRFRIGLNQYNWLVRAWQFDLTWKRLPIDTSLYSKTDPDYPLGRFVFKDTDYQWKVELGAGYCEFYLHVITVVPEEDERVKLV
jgi:hypothetical protein